jgi:aryl-alcohol dehydrogenase-like predicted oxidoreductase
MVKITGTDLVVSPLCLGCAVIGSSFDKKESFDLLDLFTGMGGNFLDTALNYADWAYPEKSISEKTIGLWMKERKNRDRVTIGTKVAQIDFNTGYVRIRKEEITEDVMTCLKNLQTDYIDLLYLHRDLEDVPAEEITETLRKLKKEGLIRYYGFSNWSTDRLKKVRELVGDTGGFAANQPMWSCARINKESLSDQTLRIMDDEIFLFHKETKLTAVPFTSQARVYFAKLEEGRVSSSLKKIYDNEENRKRFERLKKCSEETGLSVNDLSLAYLKSMPFPTVPIIGFKDKEQLLQNLKNMDITLPEKTVMYIRGESNLF